MSLKFTTEQIEFQHALRRFMVEALPQGYLHTRLAAEHSVDPLLREGIDALGLFDFFSMGVEDGADPAELPTLRELALIAFESGRALFPYPLAFWIGFGPYLLKQALDKAQRELIDAALINSICTGDCGAALVPESVLEVATNKDRLSGEVKFLACADRVKLLFLISEGRCLALPVQGSDGVEIEDTKSLDLSQRYSRVQLVDVPFIEITGLHPGNITALAEVIISAELAGICSRVVEMTVEYVSSRKQFGVPVGGFQAVQHGIADMHSESEALRSLAFFSAWSSSASVDQFPLSARSARMFALDVAVPIIEKAVQLHGGIGFTWEHELHLYLRRAKMLTMLWSCSATESDQLIDFVQ